MSKENGVSWGSLPTEVWGRVLANVEDEERCQKIPVLSKAMHKVHKDNPPSRWRWDIRQKITFPMVEWAYQIGGTLEELNVVSKGGPRAYLPQLLMAARNGQLLRRVSLEGGISQQTMSSLGFLGRLTHLTLHGWRWDNAAKGHQDGIKNLARLRKLQVFDLSIFEEETDPGAEDLWLVLAGLPLLRTVLFRTDMSNSIDEWLASMSLLSQISSLTVEEPDVVDEAHNHLWLEEVAVLQQLTSLHVNCRANVETYSPVLRLPLLRQLHILINPAELVALEEFELHVSSSNLTSFSCDGGPGIMAVQKLLPHALTLGRLMSLSLENMQLKRIAASMVLALTQLQSLKLGNNQFGRVPGSFSGLVALRFLCMKNNPTLQLRAKDVQTLESLKHLSSLVLARSSNDQWSLTSMETAIAITRKLPALTLQLHL